MKKTRKCSHTACFGVKVGETNVIKCRGCGKSWLKDTVNIKTSMDAQLNVESVIKSMEYFCRKQDKESVVRLGLKAGFTPDEIDEMYKKQTIQ